MNLEFKCGLCVRYCAEIKKAHAVGFIDRGIRKKITFLPDIALRECPSLGYNPIHVYL